MKLSILKNIALGDAVKKGVENYEKTGKMPINPEDEEFMDFSKVDKPKKDDSKGK